MRYSDFLRLRAFGLLLLIGGLCSFPIGEVASEPETTEISETRFPKPHNNFATVPVADGSSDNYQNAIPSAFDSVAAPKHATSAKNPGTSINLSTYKLQIGDTFVVTVEGYPEYSKERTPIPIQRDGYISYPLIGIIEAIGLTVSELESRMQKAFSQHLQNPRVFVTLMQTRRNILVLGAIEMRARGNPHVFETGQVYLMHALAAAGINYELADLTKITIWRDGKLYKQVDFLKLLEAGGPDIPLIDYDVIIIPSIFQQRPIRVIGAVVAPGIYPIRSQQIPAIQALKLAGGSRADFADLSKAEIITNTERISVDLTADNVDSMLGAGDTLYIPLAEAKISIIGAVDKPAEYIVTEPVLLAKAIAMAGGLDEERANPKKCILTRADGTQEEINFDLMHSEIYLYPNDQLRVRERTRIDWRVLNFAASAASLVVNVLLRF